MRGLLRSRRRLTVSPGSLALLAAYLVYSLGALFELRFDSPVRAAHRAGGRRRLLRLLDLAGGLRLGRLACRGWISALLCGYLLASAVLLHDLLRVVVTAVVVDAAGLALHAAWRNASGVERSRRAASPSRSRLHKRYLEAACPPRCATT